MQKQRETQVIAPEHAIEDFLASLQTTIQKAETVKRVMIPTQYVSALTTFLSYASLLELAFRKPAVTIEDMLHFGQGSGRGKIGVPISLTTYAPEDMEYDTEDDDGQGD